MKKDVERFQAGDEIDKLTEYILKEYPDEPGKPGGESAVDCAIRLLKEYKDQCQKLSELDSIILNAREVYESLFEELEAPVKIEQVPEEVPEPEKSEDDTCPECKGTGTKYDGGFGYQCPKCRGLGKIGESNEG